MQLENNVHEPLGDMPTLQIEHSSEHSQAFQDLTNSDSPVPGNIGCTGSDQAQWVIPGALVTPGDPSLGMLLQIDPLGLGPIQPDPTLGIWLVGLGFRLRPLTKRLCLSVRTPPLGDPPLGHAMQYSSLRSGSKRPVDRPSSSEYQSVWSATKGQLTVIGLPTSTL